MQNPEFRPLFPVGKRGSTLYLSSHRTKKNPTPGDGDSMKNATVDRRLTRAMKPATAMAAIALCLAPAWAGPKRCDWHGPKTTGEATYKQCIDYGALQGKTLNIPSNVTRISQDGISFCKNAVSAQSSLNADIVYMMDNSGSMEKGDVVDGVKSNPGDPHGIRDRVIRRAMRQQRSITDTSTAGFLSFVGLSAGVTPTPARVLGPEQEKIQHPLDISRTSDPQGLANLQTLLSKVWKHNPNEANLPKTAATQKTALTYWRDPLTLARDWFDPDSGFVKTENHAIILVSDGAISDWNEVLNLLDPKNKVQMPPVYGIHLGDSAEGRNLKDLAERTHGAFFVVSPTDTNTFYEVMQKIVGIITHNTAPKDVRVVNNSQNPAQVSRSVGTTLNPDGSIGVVLDSIIGLKEGENKIQIVATPEQGEPKVFEFTLNVSGPALNASEESYSCYEMPTLTVLDGSGQTPQIYSPNKSTYTLELTRSPSELSTSGTAVSTESGDKETVAMPVGNSNLGFPVQDAKVDIDPNAGATPQDGTIDAQNHATVTFTWTHPRDSRETVTYVLPGRIIPVVDGAPQVTMDSAVIQGEDVSGARKTDAPFVIVGKDNSCPGNCDQSDQVLISHQAGVPSWSLVIRSPLKYRMRMYDHLGQFVNSGTYEMSQADFDKLPKTGDSVVVRLLFRPFSQDGRQLGTGAYLMRLELYGDGDKVVNNSKGDPVLIRSTNKEYFNRFGYVRNFGSGN
jgi:hypothetical protein